MYCDAPLDTETTIKFWTYLIVRIIIIIFIVMITIIMHFNKNWARVHNELGFVHMQTQQSRNLQQFRKRHLLLQHRLKHMPVGNSKLYTYCTHYHMSIFFINSLLHFVFVEQHDYQTRKTNNSVPVWAWSVATSSKTPLKTFYFCVKSERVN